jgi:hypothetical protein
MDVGEHWAYQRDAYSPLEEVEVLAFGKKIRVRSMENEDATSSWVKSKRLVARWGEHSGFANDLARRLDLMSQSEPESEFDWNAAEIVLVALSMERQMKLHPLGISTLSSISGVATRSGVSVQRIKQSPSAIIENDTAEIPWSMTLTICRALAKRETASVIDWITTDREYWRDRLSDRINGGGDDSLGTSEMWASMEADYRQVEAWCGARNASMAVKNRLLRERVELLEDLARRSHFELVGKSTNRAKALVADLHEAVGLDAEQQKKPRI